MSAAVDVCGVAIGVCCCCVLPLFLLFVVVVVLLLLGVRWLLWVVICAC